jgi:hypothetical protein
MHAATTEINFKRSEFAGIIINYNNTVKVTIFESNFLKRISREASKRHLIIWSGYDHATNANQGENALKYKIYTRIDSIKQGMDVQNHSLYTYKIPIQRVPSTEKL